MVVLIMAALFELLGLKYHVYSGSRYGKVKDTGLLKLNNQGTKFPSKAALLAMKQNFVSMVSAVFSGQEKHTSHSATSAHPE